MSKKVFLSEIQELIDNKDIELSEEAMKGFEELTTAKAFTPKEITDKGKVILKDMQENIENNKFKSKDIGDRLGISGRSVSGSIRSLIALGYVEKISNEPVMYALTDAGMSFNID